MNDLFSFYAQAYDFSRGFLENLWSWQSRAIEGCLKLMEAAGTEGRGVLKVTAEFMDPSWNALRAFIDTEREKLPRIPVQETVRDYLELLHFNGELASRAMSSSLLKMNEYMARQAGEAAAATLNTLFPCEGEDLAEYAARKARLLDLVVRDYPRAILDIEPEYGFHFEDGGYVKLAETDRFELYQVLPLDPGVTVREGGKPVVIVPPYVLGANILAFLPGERKSYVHAFANRGIPTYIRIVKDIQTTEAVQLMTPEEDARDLRLFCERVMERHGRPATLNGFCQGGYMTTVALLSGELDGVADAHITCVAPLDGSRSIGLIEYMKHLPPRFRDLGHSAKTLPNGNQVIDGKIMGWVYKLKSVEKEAPIFALYRDLLLFDRPGQPPGINKTAAAINHWMLFDRCDLPLGITRMSFKSYTDSVNADGTLPVRLFDRTLNFRRFKEKGIPWLICIAEKDDLVDEPATLVPLEWVDAEVTVFPKGHTAIATSWSMPLSECPLHETFTTRCRVPSSRPESKSRGPVRFQLDLEQDLTKAP